MSAQTIRIITLVLPPVLGAIIGYVTNAIAIRMLFRPLTEKRILGLRVPLPTLVLNDADDFLYTLPEMERADRMLAEVYIKAGAEDRYHCSFYPGPHKFDQPMQDEAFDWFDRWLKA